MPSSYIHNMYSVLWGQGESGLAISDHPRLVHSCITVGSDLFTVSKKIQLLLSFR